MASLLKVRPASDEDGKLLEDDEDKRASFGAFPYIGEITAAVSVLSFVANSALASADMDMMMADLGDMADDDFDGGDGGMGTGGSSGGSNSSSNASNSSGGLVSNITVSILVKFEETFYGGVRFMFGLIVTYGNGKGYQAQKNPFKNAQTLRAALTPRSAGTTVNEDLGMNAYSGPDIVKVASDTANFFDGATQFGGPHFKIRVYTGIYVDFGYVELKELDKDGKPQKSHDMLFMGGGGFLGFGGSVGYTWAFMLVCIPAYFNLEAGIDLTIFLGNTADLAVNEALEADPVRIFTILEIFTAEFDKASQSFGPITQLTDDDSYDDFPQAVYDRETQDYIVIYNKTAQDDGAYGSPGDKLADLIGAGPDPNKTYSTICYRLYNGVQEEGDPFEVGWVNGFYPNELPKGWTSEAYVARYGPERYLPSTIRNSDGTYADPPIYDLTVASGLDHLAAFAFTVDRDYNLDTAEDRELYVQYYNFKDHGVYYPFRVAGDKVETTEVYNSATQEMEKRTSTVQVEVGTPKLVRNGGSTFLFWREDGKSLKYLNVSELLNAKVMGTADDNDGFTDGGYWKYAVRSDGTFATDAQTGETYAPNVQEVDVSSLFTSKDMEITEYEVIADQNDNLYVVWTDNVARQNQEPEEPGGSYSPTAQEIYATAMIHQAPKATTYETEEGETVTETSGTVRWSKPYRLTRSDDFNDGLALALDENGDLIIVHNRYSKLTAKSEAEAAKLAAQGKIGLTRDKEGQVYVASLAYNSPVTLSLTRCEKVGSLETTYFEFSDTRPVAGETVTVTAVIENVGLIDAEGGEVEFYEYKDGVRGAKIGETIQSDEPIQVNTAKKAVFEWTVPAEGPEGYSIQAVVREKKDDGSYYDSIVSYSDTFISAPDYRLDITEAVQEGDQFRIGYSVANRGNAPAEEGTTVAIQLVGLYGDLDSELYGNVKERVLYSADITDKLSTKTVAATDSGKGIVEKAAFEDVQYVTIPASVFRYCGYDAVILTLLDAQGNVIEETSKKLVAMEKPMNLSLNGGKALHLEAGESVSAALSYDTTAFLNDSAVVYTMADPDVAEVDEQGNVTAVSGGTTTLTATHLPSGRSATIDLTVTVGEDSAVDSGDDTWYSAPVSSSSPSSSGSSSSTVQPSQTTTAFSDVDETMWYYEGVQWAVDHELMNGIGDGKFDPNGDTSRAMLVTMLWRLEGQPQAEQELTFQDVDRNAWYTEAVRWATQQGIVTGYDAQSFGPNDRLTREQLALILCRYASKKGAATASDGSLATFQDTEAVSAWALDSLDWAVSAGIVNGTGGGMLSPQNSASRAKVATMLMRYATKNQ